MRTWQKVLLVVAIVAAAGLLVWRNWPARAPRPGSGGTPTVTVGSTVVPAWPAAPIGLTPELEAYLQALEQRVTDMAQESLDRDAEFGLKLAELERAVTDLGTQVGALAAPSSPVSALPPAAPAPAVVLPTDLAALAAELKAYIQVQLDVRDAATKTDLAAHEAAEGRRWQEETARVDSRYWRHQMSGR